MDSTSGLPPVDHFSGPIEEEEAGGPPAWSVVAMHAVPAVGVLIFGWSIALVLIFYWLENLVSVLIWNRAIRRHHDLTGMRGHYRNQIGVSSGKRPIEFFPSEYRSGPIFFTVGHGFFIAILAFLILDGAELESDLMWIGILAAISIFLTWEELRPVVRDVEKRSFHWLRTQASRSVYQVWAMHAGVILGAWSLALDEGGFILILIFIGLRIVADIFKNRPAPRRSELRPPWFSIHLGQSDESPEERRKRAMDDYQRQLAEDELPFRASE